MNLRDQWGLEALRTTKNGLALIIDMLNVGVVNV
jgi:hypothetical protein